MRRLRLVGVVVFAALAASTAPATADDASVWAAYTVHDAEIDAAGQAWQDALDYWDKHPRRIDVMITAERNVLKLVREIEAGIATQPSSSAAGERGKQLLLRGSAGAVRGHRLQLAGFVNTKRRTGKGMRYMRAAARAFRKGRRYEKRGVAVFKRLGIAPADYGASP